MSSEVVVRKSKQIKPPKLFTNTDAAWKDILQLFFKEFIEFFWPDIYQDVDWEKGYEFLDKEFQSIVKHEKNGKRLTDKLIKVWHKNLNEFFIVIHVEIQGREEVNFSLRMFNYYYRIWDRYKVPVICLAVFTDKDHAWRPDTYEMSIWNSHLKYNFPIVKLTDYESQLETLEKNENPFALVVLCQLAALKSKNDLSLKKSLKFNLAKNLFKRKWHKDKIIALFKFIDGILRLPEEIELELVNEIRAEIAEESDMSYVTSFEYFAELRGIEKGTQEGIQQGIQKGIQKGEARMLISQLKSKFKVIPNKYKSLIESANPDVLLTWANRVLYAKTIEEVFNENLLPA